jgi:glucose/arabinose dehydrogenase
VSLTSGSRCLRAALFLLVVAGSLACRAPSEPVEPTSWMSDWELPEGFTIGIDVEGFDFPTAIAFVPHPGPGPKSPFYFVTELRGKVKVVTNDRSVYTFAEVEAYRPADELPDIDAESGLAAVTLDPVHGYVFVSFAYQDKHKLLRNNIVRFDSEPGVFGLKAGAMHSFTDILKADIARVTHQVGAMVIVGDEMYVGVGDGGQHFQSQKLDNTLGKVLRMSLDGKPLPDNPFYEDEEVWNSRNYVWALGMRNPFGLCRVNGRLFATENGFQIDRFIEVHRGQNLGWDGTDWSIGMNSPMVFGPTTVSPVHVAWLPEDNPLFPPAYRSKFYVALHGGQTYNAGLVTLEYDFAGSRLAGRPRQFLLHTSEKKQRVQMIGVAVGPDGLYAVPLYPVRREKGAKGVVLKIAYAPGKEFRKHLASDDKVEVLMTQRGCFSCHGRQPTDLNVAPPLDRETLVPRVLLRLRTKDYREQLAEIEALNMRPYSDFKEARRQVMAASGMDQARLWIRFHVLEPKFDRISSAMPNLDLTDAEAEEIAEYLVRRNIGDVGVAGFFKSLILPYVYGPASRRHLPGAFAMGFVAASGLIAASYFGRKLVKRRRR